MLCFFPAERKTIYSSVNSDFRFPSFSSFCSLQMFHQTRSDCFYMKCIQMSISFTEEIEFVEFRNKMMMKIVEKCNGKILQCLFS